MHLTDPGATPRPDNDVRLLTIGSRNQLPARVRSLLEGMLALAGGILERSISLTLNEYEQQLFKLAEKARNSNEQHAVFESLREVKRGRADVAPRFMLYFESALAHLDEKQVPATAPQSRRFHEMALVETRDLEENIALQEIATKAEIRHSQALYALGHRFGVLAGAPALDTETLPVGPHQLCESLRYATSCLGIALDHRLLLFRQFDRLLMSEIAVLYNSINDYLIEKHILRFLQVSAPRLHGNKSGAGASAAADAHDAESNAAQAPAAPERSAPGYAPAAHPDMGQWQSPGQRGGSGTSARSGPPAGVAGQRHGDAHAAGMKPEMAPSRPGRNAADDPRDSELFHTLRELLSGRRQVMGAPPSAPGSQSSYTANGEDLQAVLGNLQNKPIAPMMMGGRVVQRNIGHLKQDLLNQLRQFTPDNKPPQLGEEDSDTLDLVGMLFDFIAKDTRPNGATQSLLTKLQVPVLRVALRDKSFFTRRTHPARQLLNAIAETGQYWIDESDGETDRTLVEKMQLVVDRVGSEFDGQSNLFEELLTDLSRHMGTLARKAEVAERRHVDAAKGRERLDMARERAVGAIGERLGNKKINRLVRTLLEQAWTDVLALTILRQGEDSDAYRRRIGVADQLIAGNAGADLANVRNEIEQGLSQVGFHAEEIQAMVSQLLVPSDALTEDNPSTRTELALKLKAKARLGEDSPSGAPDTARAAARQRTIDPPLNAEERQTLERLKTVPYGTWFEFVQNQQGDAIRRKLSWFSTLTGRCLFVNQRGARTDERSMEQLARDLVRGQVRIVTSERDSLIDRAWAAIVGTLKQFTGKAVSAQPAT